jgi:hypothetical protein
MLAEKIGKYELVERLAVARTDASLMKVNDSTIDRAAEVTQLRFHRAFVRTLIERLSDATSLLAQLRRA